MKITIVTYTTFCHICAKRIAAGTPHYNRHAHLNVCVACHPYTQSPIPTRKGVK